MIIDGITLSYALKDHGDMLRQLCLLCVAVLCCRMSPLQKAEVNFYLLIFDISEDISYIPVIELLFLLLNVQYFWLEISK